MKPPAPFTRIFFMLFRCIYRQKRGKLYGVLEGAQKYDRAYQRSIRKVVPSPSASRSGISAGTSTWPFFLLRRSEVSPNRSTAYHSCRARAQKAKTIRAAL